MKAKHFILTTLFGLSLFNSHAQCNAAGSHYTATYPGGWNLVDLGDGTNAVSFACDDKHNGTIYSLGTAAYFITARNAKELRLSRAIPTVSNSTWTMDFTLIITGPPMTGALPNNSPSVVLAALTTDQISLQSGCFTAPGGDFCTSCGTYPNTNMDAIWVSLTSTIPNGCSDSQGNKNWRIVASARDGNGTPINSIPISIPSGATGTYYVRLQRTAGNSAVVSVYSNSNYSTHLAGSPQCFSIPGTVENLDCLSHEVHSQGGCQRTFNGTIDHLKIDNNLLCAPSLSASFTMPSEICEGQPIVVNGSASTGSPFPVANHIWIAEECDAAGNPIGGPIWWDNWQAGSPSGNYTLSYASMAAAGLNVTCGKYYRISLAIQNCAVPWISSTQIIKVNCNPIIKFDGSSEFVCKGDAAGLSAYSTNGSGDYTMLWETISPFASEIYSGPPAAVLDYPNSTTTYQVTITDNVTGCSSTAQWTVTVTTVDPSFSLSVNTSNPSYFTLSMNANDPNGYSVPGFFYGLGIEELDPFNNPYYGFWGTDCWWNYPGAETYLGFVSTGTGTYTPSPWQPFCGTTPGKFLYNHTYRITRGVQNDYCPWKEFSMIVTVNKANGAYVINMSEDPGDANGTRKETINTASKQNTGTDVNIYPNPSNGLYTIELGSDMQNASIRVTDSKGQLIKSYEQQNVKSQLDLTGFAKGVYTISITGNGAPIVKKLILD